MKIKSTKLIFLYRSFIFRFTKFSTTDKKLNNIVKALNIKKRKQRIEYVYDEAIKYINKYYSDDLCQFKNNQCLVQRQKKVDKINGCCGLCIYQNSKGCKVDNISCKLFYCDTALRNMKKLDINQIDILKCFNLRQRFIVKSDFFATREQVINDLYYGILIATIRVSYRQLKSWYISKKRYRQFILKNKEKV